MTTRTTRISVETNTFLVVRGAKAMVAWCPGCAARVDVLTLTAVAGDSSEELERWVGADKLHLWHSSEGAVQVCVDSLLHSCAYEQTRPSGRS